MTSEAYSQPAFSREPCFSNSIYNVFFCITVHWKCTNGAKMPRTLSTHILHISNNVTANKLANLVRTEFILASMTIAHNLLLDFTMSLLLCRSVLSVSMSGMVCWGFPWQADVSDHAHDAFLDVQDTWWPFLCDARRKLNNANPHSGNSQVPLSTQGFD